MWTLTWTAFYYCTLNSIGQMKLPPTPPPPLLLRGNQQYTICVLKLYIKQLNTLSFTEYVGTCSL